MQLKKLELENYCRHRALEIEFPIGVTGIIGPNGSGKSTIARALRFALLGDSGMSDAKADDLSWALASAPDASGGVKLLFQLNGQEGTIKRAIMATRASLDYGELGTRKAKQVNDLVLQLMGVTQHTIEHIIFVMQGQLERLLFDQPADRKRSFHALFGIEQAEVLRDLLRQELTTLGVAPDSAAVEKFQHQLDNEIDPTLRQLMGEQAKLTQALVGCDTVAAQAVVESFLKARGLGERLEQLRAKLTALQSTQASAPREQMQAALNEATARVAQVQTAAAAVNSQLAGVESALRLAETARSVQTRLHVTGVQLGELLPPLHPGITQESLAQLDKELQDLAASLAPKRSFVEVFKFKTGDPHCPTCGQKVAGAGMMSANYEAELGVWDKEIAAGRSTLVSSRKSLEQYAQAEATYQATKVQLQHSVIELQQQLAQLGTVPDVDTEAVKRLRESASQYAVDLPNLVRAQAALAASLQSCAGIDGQLQAVQAEIDTLAAAMAKAPATEQVKQAEELLSQYETWRVAKAEIEGKVTQLQAQRANVLVALEQAKAQVDRYANVSRYQQLCERARSLFHHDCLPQLAVKSYLGELNRYLARYLELFRVPFTCRIKDDLSVVCDVPGAGERPAARLSGGQKVMLGIAFRFGVYELFARNLGFMILDEPTVYLDDDRVATVADMLDNVRQFARNANMQLIVITHEQELARTFDKVVQLA